jgi:dolichol-phosphate mannosyltransferase
MIQNPETTLNDGLPGDPDSLIATPAGALRIGAAHQTPEAAIRLSIVLPTYNESRNIAEIVGRLEQLLGGALGTAYEIIIVDDDSPDGTWKIAAELARTRPGVRAMRRQRERGLSSAVIRGWQVARGEYLGVIDADLQHPPEIVLGLLEEILRGADIAVASRHIQGGGVSDWGLHRRFISRAAQLCGLVLLPGVVGRVSDPMSGCFIVRRAAIEGVELRPLGYKILIEVLGRGRCAWIGEVPYVFRERTEGESKVSLKIYLEYLQHLARLRIETLPIARFVRFATVGLSGVVVDMGVLYLLSDPSTLGWGLTRSKLIAAELAIMNNFLWNDAWTFADLSRNQGQFRQRLRRFGKFQVICFSGLVLNTLILNLLFNAFGINRYVADAIAIGAVTGWNFWLNLKLSWRVTGPATGARRPADALTAQAPEPQASIATPADTNSP